MESISEWRRSTAPPKQSQSHMIIGVISIHNEMTTPKMVYDMTTPTENFT